jgi:hypothetical protein
MTDNPFELLRLPPTASDEEAVLQGERLCQQAPDEATRDAIRQAVRQLTGSAEERTLHALLTHPRPDHGNVELERFQDAFREPPKTETIAGALPALDVDEVRELLRHALAEELEPIPTPWEPVAADDTPEEIARQTAEALWQSLVSDMRG